MGRWPSCMTLAPRVPAAVGDSWPRPRERDGHKYCLLSPPGHSLCGSRALCLAAVCWTPPRPHSPGPRRGAVRAVRVPLDFEVQVSRGGCSSFLSRADRRPGRPTVTRRIAGRRGILRCFVADHVLPWTRRASNVVLLRARLGSAGLAASACNQRHSPISSMVGQVGRGLESPQIGHGIRVAEQTRSVVRHLQAPRDGGPRRTAPGSGLAPSRAKPCAHC